MAWISPCIPDGFHALIGENGAGKSTMMKIMGGLPAAKLGRGAAARRPREVRRSGRGGGAGHLADPSGIQPGRAADGGTETSFSARELRRGWLLDKPAMRARSRELLGRLRCDVDPDRQVSELSNSDKQMVEIAKALLRDTRVLIMGRADGGADPHGNRCAARPGPRAAAITARQCSSPRTSSMKWWRIADDLTIMRDGSVVWSGAASEMDEHRMAEAMVGREISTLYPKTGTPARLGAGGLGFSGARAMSRTSAFPLPQRARFWGSPADRFGPDGNVRGIGRAAPPHRARPHQRPYGHHPATRGRRWRWGLA